MDAFNNGANDVANAWATSVSSRSISYRQAMVLGTIFEMLGVRGRQRRPALSRQLIFNRQFLSVPELPTPSRTASFPTRHSGVTPVCRCWPLLVLLLPLPSGSCGALVTLLTFPRPTLSSLLSPVSELPLSGMLSLHLHPTAPNSNFQQRQ